MMEERRHSDPKIEEIKREIKDFREEMRNRADIVEKRAEEIRARLDKSDNLQTSRHESNTDNFDRLNKLADRINWGWKVLIGICVILGGTTKFIFNLVEYVREHMK